MPFELQISVTSPLKIMIFKFIFYVYLKNEIRTKSKVKHLDAVKRIFKGNVLNWHENSHSFVILSCFII